MLRHPPVARRQGWREHGATTAGLARWGAVVALGLAVSLPTGAASAAEANAPVRHVWLDAQGEPLPFQENAEIEEFLREARVVGREKIGVGINQMHRLLVEKEGVQAHAIFRTVDVVERGIRVGDRIYMEFKDSWAGECAAYAVTKLFGIDNVPPTVKRYLDGKQGSMQIWVEKARDHTAKDFRPHSPIAWIQQLWGMSLFDNLVFNSDRNTGNMLAGEHYRLWLIDHTRAFQPVDELLSPEKIEHVKRKAWTKLQETSGEALADATREYLDPSQVQALAARRDLLVEHIQGLIEERGEDAVVY